jgi:hypothetical protein
MVKSVCGSGDSQPHKRQKSSLLAGVVGVALLRKSADDLDADQPSVVRRSKKSSELGSAAMEYVTTRRDPEDAIASLKRTAGRQPKELRRAAAAIRFYFRIDEERTTFVANRYLLAAAGALPYEVPSDEEEAWFARLEELKRLPEEQSFAVLAEHQPSLVEFKEVVVEEAPRLRQGREHMEYMEGIARKLDRPPPDEQPWDLIKFVCNGLKPLVGPEAQSQDRLVTTKRAYELCRIYLLELVGVELHD